MMVEQIGWFLHRCASTKAVRAGTALHAAAMKSGSQADVLIGNHVLNLYAKCGSVDSARQVFDEMPQRNLVSWSAMVSGYDQSNRPRLALRLFSEMLSSFKPNEFIFASALSSCSSVKGLNIGLQIHAQVLKLSYDYVSFVFNSLIMMYMKCNVCCDALLLISSSKSDVVNLISYNIAIKGLTENKQHGKGIEMFKILHVQGMVPDRFTFAALFGYGEPVYGVLVVVQLHCQMMKLGLDCVAFSANVLITLYSKFDSIEESEKVFRLIEDKDAISWNTMIVACCRCEDKSKALDLFRQMEMIDSNVSPNDYTYASLLSAAAGWASMRHGKEIHCRLVRTMPGWDVAVGNALINTYAKSGSIGSAYAVFKEMENRNLVSWNSMIAAFACHGLPEKAIALFEEMSGAGVQPDSVTFLELLTASNHSGLVEFGQTLFTSMSKVYGITPSIEHICCLVDLLGRSGRVTEAVEHMHRYSIVDDAVVLGSLLSTCRLHGGVIPGEQIAKRLLELSPVTTSPYVLLSNLYASNAKWDDVAGTRKLLKSRALRREGAYSLCG